MPTLTIAHDGDYSTFAAAEAAASDNDIIEIGWLDSAERLPTILMETPETNKNLTIKGTAPAIFRAPDSAVQYLTSGQTLTFENLIFSALDAAGDARFWFSGNQTISFKNCLLFDTGIYCAFATVNMTMINCAIIHNGTTRSCIRSYQNSRFYIYNCVLAALGGEACIGYNNDYAKAGTFDLANSILMTQSGVDPIYSDTGDISVNADSHNIVSETCALLTGTNYVRTPDQIGFAWADGDSVADVLTDWRVDQPSELAGVTTLDGVDLTGLYTTDIDGRTRSQYSIGASEGFKLYSAPSQTATPTGLAVADNGDGITWSVTTTVAGTSPSVYIYNQADDTLVAVLDTSADTADLAAGTSVYAKALESGETISGRYPAASGVAVPALTSSVPSAPSISTATAGDTQVALTIDAATESDVVYVRYRALPSGDWSAESETFKRTGDGALTVTGLTNGTRYQFAAYAKSGSLTSDWSETESATPTDGTNDPDGVISAPLSTLRDMVAASSTFQTLVSSDDTETAKSHIMYFGIDPAARWAAGSAYASGQYAYGTSASMVYECTTAGTSGASAPSWPTTDGETVADGTAVWTARAATGGAFNAVRRRKRPFAIIANAGSWKAESVARGDALAFRVNADAVLVIEADAPDAYADTESEAGVWFANFMGDLLADILDQSGKSAKLNITDAELAEFWRNDPDARNAEGDYFVGAFAFSWTGLGRVTA